MSFHVAWYSRQDSVLVYHHLITVSTSCNYEDVVVDLKMIESDFPGRNVSGCAHVKNSPGSQSTRSENTASSSLNNSDACLTSRKSEAAKRGELHHKKKMDKESRKKLLMKLVKNEMMIAWEGEMHEETPSVASSVDENLQRATSADMFYAMMNCEDINLNGSISGLNNHAEIDDAGFSEIESATFDDRKHTTFDQKLFTNLDFPVEELKSPKSRSKRSSPKMSKRRSFDMNSLALTRSFDESFDFSEEDESGNLSHSSQAASDAGLSVREIEEFVAANMPKHVRDQIPKEAWQKIFGRSLSQRTAESKIDYEMIETENSACEGDCDDILTSVSDITDPTALLEAKNGFQFPGAPGNRRETRWESDDLPPELMPTGLSSESPSEAEDSAVPRTKSSRVDFAGEVKSMIRGELCNKDSLKVTFDNVQVRFYERILDINPAVTNGPAIGIGWRYKRGGNLPVDVFEGRKGETTRSNELLLPRHVREAILKDIGYSQQDIAGAVRLIRKAKHRRKQTVQNLGAESMEEAIESVRRRVRIVLSMGRRNGLLKT